MWHRLNNSGDVYKKKSRGLRRETEEKTEKFIALGGRKENELTSALLL